MSGAAGCCRPGTSSRRSRRRSWPRCAATWTRSAACCARAASRNTDLALRSFAAFLLETAPEVTTHRAGHPPPHRGLQALAGRPARAEQAAASPPRPSRTGSGTLRMFFVRIDEWGWDEAPPRVPMFPGDLPRQDHPLPKALDDAAAAKLLRAAQTDPRLLVRVTVEVLLRTGLRVSEFTALRADAVVQIGAAPWLHVPVGKLREDRYLPLHPHLVDADRRLPHRARPAGPPAAAAPGERPAAGPAHRHPDPEQGRRRGRAARTSTPTSCATPWPPRRSTAACAWRRSPRCSATAAWT